MRETMRCKINPVSANDIPDLETLYADKDVWAYLGGVRSTIQIKDGIEEIISFQGAPKYFVVRRKEDASYIGSIALDKHHNNEDTEISYMFLSSCRGKGYAFETVSVMIEYAFQTLPISRLVAETQTLNMPSCKMLKRLGFSEVDRLNRFDAEQTIFAINRTVFMADTRQYLGV